MKRRASRALVALTLAVLGACSPGTDAESTASSAAGVDADGIPTPDLSGVDPDVVRAIDEERSALQQDLDSATAWGKLGTRYFVHEFESQAEICFARAEELEPDKGAWAYRRGLSLFDERPEQALVCFERALENIDGYAPLFEAMASGLVRLGRTDEAFDWYQRATEADPASAHAETGLGQIELGRGQLDEARVHLEEALSRDEKHAEAHVALAQVYLGLGRTADAERHAARSRELPPATERKDWLAGMSAAPAGFQARTKSALQLERAGQFDQAIEQFRLALESNPHYEFARLRLAKLLRSQGRQDESTELLQEGLALNPASLSLERALAKHGGQ